MACSIRPYLLLVSVLGAAFALQDFQKDPQFLEWCSLYYRERSDEHLAEIYPTWKKNADLVEHHNSLGQSYTLSMNQFGHMDFRDHKTKSVHVQSSPSVPANLNNIDYSSIPTSIDWRKKGAVTAVKDQGQCGSSGVFAVVDAVSAFGQIHTGELIEVSSQEFLDCCTDANSRCGGAFVDPLASFECIGKLGGLESAESYPSQGNGSSHHQCKNNPDKIAVKINGGTSVPEGDEMSLASAVAMEPVVVMVDANRTTFALYKEGIYSDKECLSSLSHLDHEMLVVGYGVENGMPYWICKNSWGKMWGEEGYIRIARNADNTCGIATRAAYPN